MTKTPQEKKRDEKAREYLEKQGFRSQDATANAAVILSRMYLDGLARNDSELKNYATSLSSDEIAANLKFPVCRFYFDAQVMRHYAGPEWELWNGRLRDELVRSQVGGNWFFNGNGEPMSKQGGRLFCTVMAALILEVYHRHPSLE